MRSSLAMRRTPKSHLQSWWWKFKRWTSRRNIPYYHDNRDFGFLEGRCSSVGVSRKLDEGRLLFGFSFLLLQCCCYFAAFWYSSWGLMHRLHLIKREVSLVLSKRPPMDGTLQKSSEMPSRLVERPNLDNGTVSCLRTQLIPLPVFWILLV